MPIWKVKGQAGKALDATVRDLGGDEVCGHGGKVNARNLDTGTFTYSVQLAGLTPEDEIIPEYGQQFSLLRSLAQYFQGTVTLIRQAGNFIDITVSDAWWWLEKMPLTSTVADSTGATADRMSYKLPSQSLTVSLAAVLDLAIARGAPMQRGALAATFTAPEITLDQATFAQAIAELIRLTPDMMHWFDHSTSPPTFRTARRSTATVRTFSCKDLAPGWSFNRVQELKVSQVRMPFAKRAVNGLKQFDEQSSGVEVMGEVLISTGSGDELDTFLPNDYFENVFVKKATTAADAMGLAIGEAKQFIADWGYNPIRTTALNVTTINYWVGGGGLTATNYNVLATTLPAGYAAVFFGPEQADQPPDWLIKQAGLLTYIPNGDIWGSDGNVNGTTFNFDRRQAFNSIFGGDVYWFTGNDIVEMRAFRGKGLQFWLAPNAWAATIAGGGTTVYRAADYTFMNPPAGFCAGLLSTMNFDHYEGNFEIVADDGELPATADLARGCVIDLTDGLPEFTAMHGLVASEELDLESGTRRITLGVAPRLSMREFFDRVRGKPKDNIKYVTL